MNPRYPLKNSTCTVRVDTHRVVWIGCNGSCNQGRSACDCELSNAIPLREELPMNLRSSNSDGRFRRTLNAALGCDQNDAVHPMPDTTPTWLERLLAWFCGH